MRACRILIGGCAQYGISSSIWSGMVGIGLLAGIGFTMSLFIAHLAFAEQELLYQAKLGVLTASVVASLAGIAFLSRVLPRREPMAAAAAVRR